MAACFAAMSRAVFIEWLFQSSSRRRLRCQRRRRPHSSDFSNISEPLDFQSRVIQSHNGGIHGNLNAVPFVWCRPSGCAPILESLQRNTEPVIGPTLARVLLPPRPARILDNSLRMGTLGKVEATRHQRGVWRKEEHVG